MERQTSRIEAFSDGIFGVAITLLAIEIGIKEYEGANNSNLWQKILERWPEYFSYFNSFATVLLIWMGHNKIFKQLKAANHWIILANGLVLLIVVLFPYPTKTVGTFIGTAAENTAVAFYTGFTGTITISMLILNTVIWYHKKLLVNQEKGIAFLTDMMRGQVVGILSYGLITICAFYYSRLALVLTFIMWVFWAFATRDNEDDLIES
jgi:uncharacterized membrane protein